MLLHLSCISTAHMIRRRHVHEEGHLRPMRKCPPHALIRRGMEFWGPGSSREVRAAEIELHFHGTRDPAWARKRRQPPLGSANALANAQVSSPHANSVGDGILGAWKYPRGASSRARVAFPRYADPAWARKRRQPPLGSASALAHAQVPSLRANSAGDGILGAWKCPRGASSRARVAFPRHTIRRGHAKIPTKPYLEVPRLYLLFTERQGKDRRSQLPEGTKIHSGALGKSTTKHRPRSSHPDGRKLDFMEMAIF